MDGDESDLGFVREDIGLVILGTVVSNVALALAIEVDEAFGVAAGLAALFTIGVLWHLGWRLAFPKRARTARQPRSERQVFVLMALGGLLAVLAVAAVAINVT